MKEDEGMGEKRGIRVYYVQVQLPYMKGIIMYISIETKT